MRLTAWLMSRTRAHTGTPSATRRLTIACPVPPVAPATNALIPEKEPEAPMGDCRGTTSPSAGVGSSACQPCSSQEAERLKSLAGSFSLALVIP